MKILVISVHPDDETLGAGGTILEHKDKGDQIYWLIVTNIDEQNGWDKKVVEKRQKEIEMVSQAYDFEKVYKLDYPTTKLDTIPMSELIISVSEVMREVRPHTVYLPNWSDIHTDHKIAFKAVVSATKPFKANFIERILMYETMSETDITPPLIENAFLPNVFVDISNYIEKKLEIMSIYSSEIMEYPLSRSLDSIKALTRFRGSQIGVEYAEGFMLIREVL